LLHFLPPSVVLFRPTLCVCDQVSGACKQQQSWITVHLKAVQVGTNKLSTSSSTYHVIPLLAFSDCTHFFTIQHAPSLSSDTCPLSSSTLTHHLPRPTASSFHRPAYTLSFSPTHLLRSHVFLASIFAFLQWKALDEINAGTCDGMTYSECIPFTLLFMLLSPGLFSSFFWE